MKTPSAGTRQPRAPVLLVATIEDADGAREVRLRNISIGGALVEGHELPQVGAILLFRRKEIVTSGKIAWSDGRLAGIRFDRPLEPRQLLRKVKLPIAAPEPPAELYRRPGFRQRELSAAERHWARLWGAPAAADRFGE